MKQKSLLSFFGKPKKKHRLNDNESNTNQQACTIQEEKVQLVGSKKLQNTLDLAKCEVIEKSNDKDVNVNQGKGTETAATLEKAAFKTEHEEHNNDTDTTESKESEDSDSSSSDDDDEEDHTTPTLNSDTSNPGNIPHQKSEYELLRERNIARNNARLKALGLLVGTSDTKNGASASNGKKQRRRTTKAATVTNRSVAIEPTRRSSRLSGIKMNYTDKSVQEMNKKGASSKTQVNDIEEVQVEEQFKVSPLFDYQMNDGGTSRTIESNEPVGCNDKIKTLVPSGKRLVPPAGLNAIYSLQFYNVQESISSSSAWLVGAGKSGLIAVWDCNNSSRTTQEDQISYVEPVISWKGHQGRWIADARFLPPHNESSNFHVPSRLLTAGNDGTICHWDLSTTSLTTGAPRLVHQTNKLLHSSGIFSMDVKAQERDCLIVTGSKDKSIAVSKLGRLEDNDGAFWRSQFHTSKVASVSFSSSTVNPLIASASDDGLVGIHDMRLSGSDTVACLEDSHTRPHSAVWKPSSDSIFLTAGLDDMIKLWDLRNTREPVVSFHGHVPMSGRKLKRIHRPTFFNEGSESFILSGGENSHAISMFQEHEDTSDASSRLRSVFSRGKLPDGSGDVGSMAVHSNHVAVTVEGGEVIILTPQS
ncbi:hypothetical protein ACHAWT_008813 [Skeletonema menzelii]